MTMCWDADRCAAVAAVGVSAATVVAFHVAYSPPAAFNVAVAFYLFATGVLVWLLALACRREDWWTLEPAEGRIVAVVPAYNEDPYTLRACLDALLSGSVVPDVVHVVDDGSVQPIEPYQHGLVRWHRQENQGKRWAQVNALREEKADFVVTLDSDSVPHKHALRECLRALRDPGVQAATATVAVRNRGRNWLTRLVDLELVYGCLVHRRARSSLGAVAPTSGAFAVYRAPVFFDNMVDYLLSGTAGDDRRLTNYALLRGRVVGCSRAWVQTDMPDTIRQTFRQRVRWFKSYFLYLRWELRHLLGRRVLAPCLVARDDARLSSSPPLGIGDHPSRGGLVLLAAVRILGRAHVRADGQLRRQSRWDVDARSVARLARLHATLDSLELADGEAGPLPVDSGSAKSRLAYPVRKDDPRSATDSACGSGRRSRVRPAPSLPTAAFHQTERRRYGDSR